MAPRRGTKANPFEVGECVRLRRWPEHGVGVVQRVTGLEPNYRPDPYDWHPVSYLVSFAFWKPGGRTDWLHARDLEAVE